jgi:hypothetical protein
MNLNRRSTVSDSLGVSSLVVGPPRRSGLGITMSLNPQPSTRLPSRSQPSHLPMLMHRVANPINPRIIPNSLMRRIHQHHLIELISPILPHPVAIEHPQPTQPPAHPLLSHRPQIPRGLQLVDTHTRRLPRDNTLSDGSLPAASSNTDAIHDVALFGFVAELAGFVGAGGAAGAVDDGQLPVLPGAQAQDEVHDVGLFFAPEFLQVFVGSHFVVILKYNIFMGYWRGV